MEKILVVDDEKWIRKGLQIKLGALGYDEEHILSAKSGEEAMELIVEHGPEIVITDIRMPRMSGIQLMQEIEKSGQKPKMIVISGYAEFEYAEKAINMGAKGYLLKPITDEDLKKVVEKVAGELRQEKEQHILRLKANQLDRSLIDLQKEKQFNNLFTGSDLGDGIDVSHFFKEDYDCSALIIGNIDASSYFQSPFSYDDFKLLKFAVSNILHEIVSEDMGIFICNNYMNRNQLLIIAAGYSFQDFKTILEDKLQQGFTAVKKFLTISMTMGVSKIYTSLCPRQYIEAKEAYEFNFIDGKGKIYRYENIKYLTDHSIQLPKEQIKLLNMYISKGDSKNIGVLIHSMINREVLKDKSTNYISFLWFEIVGMVMHSIDTIDMNDKHYLCKSLLQSELFERYDNAEHLANYLHSTILSILDIKEDSMPDCKDLINQAKEHIDQYYDQELTVKELAIQYTMNPKYFSTLFKKEFHISPLQYITNIRLEKACSLLINTENSITDISQCVGYSDPLYFFRVFKKRYKCTPQEFRQKG